MKRLHGGGIQAVEVVAFTFRAVRSAPDQEPADRRAEVDAYLAKYVPDGRKRGPCLRRLEAAIASYGFVVAMGFGMPRAPKRVSKRVLERLRSQVRRLLSDERGLSSQLADGRLPQELEARIGLAEVESWRSITADAENAMISAEKALARALDELKSEPRMDGPHPRYPEVRLAAAVAIEWRRVTGKSLARHNRPNDDGGPFPEFLELVGTIAAAHFGAPTVSWRTLARAEHARHRVVKSGKISN